MSNPFQLTFTLKQHTPIIHFQHDQEGATLRASEVKPKLDKYAIRKLKEENKSIPDSWYSNKEKGSLDYKLRIMPVFPYIYPIPKGENIGAFFGAMGNDYNLNPRCLSIAVDEIQCVITAKDILLKEVLENFLNSFIALNNFGMRQSKGFGSFSLLKIGDKVQDFPVGNFTYSFKLDFAPNVSDISSHKKLASSIDVFYRSLRSGINLSGRNGESLYFKSALFVYLNNRHIQWDKKTIKANYFNKNKVSVTEKYKDKTKKEKTRTVNIKYIPSQQSDHTKDGIIPDILANPQLQNSNLDYKLFRDRLGLSSEEKWYSYRESITKTEAKQILSGWQRKRKDEEQVVRYKSPILFKVFIDEASKKATIYFDVFEDKNTLLEFVKSVFTIDTKPERNVHQLTNQNGLIMPVANTTNLDLKSFLSETFNSIDITTHIKSPKQNKQIIFVYDTLVKIYKQLKPKDNEQ